MIFIIFYLFVLFYRGDGEHTAEMEAAGAGFISPNRAGDEGNGLSSEKELQSFEVQAKLDELADYENDDDAPLALSNKNTGSRRQLRMVIDMDEEDE